MKKKSPRPSKVTVRAVYVDNDETIAAAMAAVRYLLEDVETVDGVTRRKRKTQTPALNHEAPANDK